jgi:photosystem II stability/assembly factor-like uncharacterized protein
MTTTIYLTTGDGLAIIRRDGEKWRAELRMEGLPTYCVEADPLTPERVYCGTFGRGLWRSDDGGDTWRPVGDGISHAEVMAVAVSASERVEEYGVVWAGTEPSAVFRSEDRGDTWQEMHTLRDLPSAPTWSFPPRPWTHHVRWIAPDPNLPNRIFVGIELGGVMRSLDGGLTWEDRKPGGQHDAHHLRTHPLASGRVYESAGGGYAESHDGGESWMRLDEGLAHHYMWGLAVDPADPDTVVVSAARGPYQAHNPDGAEATVYRKTKGQHWQEARIGLPDPRGTRVYVLAANSAEPRVFYAATHKGEVYRSPDAGTTWQRLDIAWPDGYRPNADFAPALAVLDSPAGSAID